MRSELPWVQVVLFFYPESVVAKTFPVGNNPFRISCCWGNDLYFALQPWATRNNAFGVDTNRFQITSTKLQTV